MKMKKRIAMLVAMVMVLGSLLVAPMTVQAADVEFNNFRLEVESGELVWDGDVLRFTNRSSDVPVLIPYEINDLRAGDQIRVSVRISQELLDAFNAGWALLTHGDGCNWTGFGVSVANDNVSGDEELVYYDVECRGWWGPGPSDHWPNPGETDGVPHTNVINLQFTLTATEIAILQGPSGAIHVQLQVSDNAEVRVPATLTADWYVVNIEMLNRTPELVGNVTDEPEIIDEPEYIPAEEPEYIPAEEPEYVPYVPYVPYVSAPIIEPEPIMGILGWVSPFADITVASSNFSAIRFVTYHDLFAEPLPANFNPNGFMTRGMFVHALWRIVGEPPVGFAHSFVDVAAADAGAVSWAVAMGIVVGANNNEFRPGELITVRQAETMLNRFSSYFNGFGWHVGTNRTEATRDQVANMLYELYNVSW